MNKVIIIGAGLAGLSADAHLRKAGIESQILEARDRSGGRVLTDYRLGVPVNCGAAWIHGDEGNPMTALAHKTNAPMLPIESGAPSGQSIVYNRKGQPIDKNRVEAFNQQFDVMLQRANQNALANKNDVTLAHALQPEIEAANLSDIEQALLQRQLSYFDGYMGANYEKLSARYFNLEETWPGSNCFMQDGYQPIIQYLSEDSTIQKNTIVKAIHLRNEEVVVTTNQSSYIADKVIITVPLGVLKKNNIVFDPPLPARKLTAIQRLGMGLLNITFLKFPQVFWPADIAMFSQTNIDPLSIPIFLNLHHINGQPILMGYHGGDRSRQIESLSDQALQQHVTKDLRRIFGKKYCDPIAMITTRWSQDPYSYGSYSYVAPFATADDFDALAEPIADRLFFAGEATTGKYYATTHGAYLSGIRAAAEAMSDSNNCC